MAINVVIPLLIPLEEDLHNATRLLSGSGRSMIEFSQSRYCAVVREDSPTSSDVITVSAAHKGGEAVKYSISGGNTDGLFSIDENTGVISVASSLDFELAQTHEIVVTGEGNGHITHAVVHVSVADVNDNAPVFRDPHQQVTVIEEDDRHLPASLIKVQAEDLDQSDSSNLRYSLRGDGVDGYVPGDAYFTVDRHTGDVIQLRALDRDPPNGKRIWRLKVKVEDGQNPSMNKDQFGPESETESERNDAPWSYEDNHQNDDPLNLVKGRDSKSLGGYFKFDTSDSNHHAKDDSTQSIFYKSMNDPSAVTNVKHKARRKTRNLRKRIESRIESREQLEQPVLEDIMQLALGNYHPEAHSHRKQEEKIFNITYRKYSDSEEKNTPGDEHHQMPLYARLDETNQGAVRQRRHQRSKVNRHENVYKIVSHIGDLEKTDSVFAVGREFQSFVYSEEHPEETMGDSIAVSTNKNRHQQLQQQQNHHYSQSKSKERRRAFLWRRKSKDKDDNHKRSEIYNIFINDTIGDNERDDFRQQYLTSKEGTIPNQEMIPRFMFKKYAIKSDHGQVKNDHEATNGISKNLSNWHDGSTFVKSRKRQNFQEFSSEGFRLPRGNKKTWNDESLKVSLKTGSNSGSPANYWEISSPSIRKMTSLSPLSVEGKLRSSDSYKETSRDEISAGSILGDEFDQVNSQLYKKEIRGGRSEGNSPLTPTNEGLGGNSPSSLIKEDSGGNSPSNSFKKESGGNSPPSFIHGIGSSRLATGWRSKQNRDPLEKLKRVRTFHQESDFPKSSKSSDFLVSYASRNVSFQSPSKLPLTPSPLPVVPEKKKDTRKGRQVFSASETLEDTANIIDISKTKVRIIQSLTTETQKSNPDTITEDTLKSGRREKREMDHPGKEDSQMHSKTLDEYSFSNWLATPRNVRNAVRGSDNVRDAIMESGQCPEPTVPSSPQESWVVHSAEATVTIVVKDINDNPPTFPNVTMFGEIRENGPADLPVVHISAYDTDDASEGTNARITYIIEKNVIHDKTGEAIFRVQPQTGLISTALCCLDREATPEYNIQVVAADGGGLRGTGTVIVRLNDENDNPPRLTRKSWLLVVNETYGEGPLDGTTLLEMTAVDPDADNDFSFRVVEESGYGWDRFSIRSTGPSGQLYATKRLDYEDPEHLRGFKFMVQVTDRGEEGWSDPRHQDTAWVGVKLKDLNDNPPLFVNPNAQVTVREDTAPGALLFNMTAHDPDRGRGGRIEFQVLDGWDTLEVDKAGRLTLSRPLDREGRDGDENTFRILATDRGYPPLTSTGTLTITVSDVNDCPPRLLEPTALYVQENEPPVLLGVLRATDDDVWTLGHGPPFTISMGSSNPPYIQELVELRFHQRIDSGRGGAELWSRRPLDREEHRELQVKVLVTDAGQLQGTSTVVVVVGDLNDNPMEPASKTVYLWKTQNTGSDAPLGRVYVDDPDDWDVADKTFQWAGKPHPLFTLNEEDGTIYASSHLREGRYDLQFGVTDRVWEQVGVSANVSVVVKVLTQESLAHATPINLLPTTPTQLTKGWRPSTGGGIMGELIRAIRRIIGAEDYTVEVVSVYGTDSNPTTAFVSFPPSSDSRPDAVSHPNDTRHPRNPNQSPSIQKPSPYACVWVSAMDQSSGAFMDPVKLQGLLALSSKKLEHATGLLITFKDPSRDFGRSETPLGQSQTSLSHATVSKGFQVSGSSSEGHPAMSTLKHPNEEGPGTVASLASTVLPLQVVDTNITSLVTPLLLRPRECGGQRTSSVEVLRYNPDSCTPSSCLNGGRCIPFPTGSRCICPGGTKGPHCKILSRTFRENGWTWLKPLPSCLPVTISFKLLTKKNEGLLLYGGPLIPPSEADGYEYSSMLTVQMVERMPELLVKTEGEFIRLRVNSSLVDGEWHTIHVRLDEMGAALMTDMCGLGWSTRSSSFSDSHCVDRRSWEKPGLSKQWETNGPLQVGGMAQTRPKPEDYGWEGGLTSSHFEGCLSHLTINGQVVDLGEPPYSQRSSPGCQPQESACDGGPGACGIRGECTSGLKNPECQCEPGWSSKYCDVPTVPTTLGSKSYMKIALSFAPPSEVIVVQVRVRSLGAKTGMLLQLAAQHTNNTLNLQLRAGVACASMSGPGWGTSLACVKGRPVGDGKWHTIRAERHGHNLLAVVDDGDEGRCNHSMPSLTTSVQSRSLRKVSGTPMPLAIDNHDGVIVGGRPVFKGTAVVSIRDDLQDICLDDLRVSGRQLPLPPAVNGSSWAQVTSSHGLAKGCRPSNSCSNTTCERPLSCKPDWMQLSCSCGPGHHLVDRKCVDINECLLDPCLHGGTCVNSDPGYECLCGPAHLGDNCEWTRVTTSAHPLSAPVVIGAITFSFFLLVVLGVYLCVRHHRLRGSRGESAEGESTRELKEKDLIRSSETYEETITIALDPKDSVIPETVKDPRSGAEERKGPGDESHSTFLRLLKLSRQNTNQELQVDGGGGTTRSNNSGGGGIITMAVIASPGENGTGALPLPPHPCPHHQQPHLPGEDLRNYAYEGDGSSSGSLASAISGLQAELDREEGNKVVAKEFVEVMDLLRNLPDYPKSSSLRMNLKQKQKFPLEEGKDLEETLHSSRKSPSLSRAPANVHTAVSPALCRATTGVTSCKSPALSGKGSRVTSSASPTILRGTARVSSSRSQTESTVIPTGTSPSMSRDTIRDSSSKSPSLSRVTDRDSIGKSPSLSRDDVRISSDTSPALSGKNNRISSGQSPALSRDSQVLSGSSSTKMPSVNPLASLDQNSPKGKGLAEEIRVTPC